MNRYIYKNGKKMKYGYTTGTCAAGATKACVQMLLKDKKIRNVKIHTPKGWTVKLKIEDIEINDNFVKCSVIKDAGDDPDITDKIKIFSKVSFNNKNQILGGFGVGKVTEEGLPVKVGKPAINPVPRKMILKELKNNKGKKFKVIIEVPEGKKIAKKTFNPRLGIVGGISILGTSGIVEPMSDDSLKKSILLEIKQKKHKLKDVLVFNLGNYGKDFSQNFKIDEKYLLKTSNYIGFSIEKIVEHGFKKVILIGHVGKLIKIAGGNFNTHSRVSDSRLEILTAFASLEGLDKEILKKIYNSTTTDMAISIIKKHIDINMFFNKISEKIKEKMIEYSYKDLNVAVYIFSNKHGFLGKTKNFKKLLEEIK